MKPPHPHNRIDLSELKAEIVKKLGAMGSKQYFYYLSKFLNLKISKVEFNKLCLRIVGRENIPLHNQFLHSILNNACNAKAPPPKEALKSLHKQNEPNPLILPNWDHFNHINSDIKLENGHLSERSVHHHHQILTKELENGEVPRHRHDTNVSKILKKSDFCAASSFSIGSLLESSELRERMEKIALMQGLKGVTMDCASLLNKGLDSYLKGLISSGVELMKSRLDSEPTQSYTNKHQANDTHLSGIQNKRPFCVSLLDFKVAMELNPQQMGEDWPLLVEKICINAFSEE